MDPDGAQAPLLSPIEKLTDDELAAGVIQATTPPISENEPTTGTFPNRHIGETSVASGSALDVVTVILVPPALGPASGSGSETKMCCRYVYVPILSSAGM